jgi:TolB-like protein/Flp pilus assembly protein TadD
MTDQKPNLVHLRLLGGLELQQGSGPAVIPAGRKVRALLACLALSPGRAWPREKLMALLWSDRSDEQARASLRQALAEMRRELGQPAAVRTEHDAVSLDPALLAVDALEFERLAVEGKWEEASALYRGPLLDGHGVRDGAFEDWLRGERTRLHDLAIDVLERLAASRSGEAAIAMAQRLLALDPAREQTHRLLMRLYAAVGQRAQALRQYEHCRDVLQRDLQAKPDAETEELHRRIQSETLPTSAARISMAKPVQDSPPGDRPSIAVLPFTNMSDDRAQDYFSDGITEDIITELSRFRSLFVIARNSSFAFKGSASDVRDVGRRLGVRYVVEGSVRRAGNRIRVTAQLIDAETGNHVWAERYDRELADIFDVQDDVTRQIVINIAPRLQAADQLSARRRAPEDMRAYDHYLQAKLLIDTPRDIADLELGRDHCERAIEIDPQYARAHAYRSESYLVGIALMEMEDLAEWQAQALASAERAVALDDLDNICHLALGEAAFWAGQPDRARRHVRQALGLNPNDADVLALASYVEAALGDPEASLRYMKLALERNPTNPRWYHWVTGVALATLGRYEEALKEYDQFGPPHADIFKLRAIALVQLGRLEEARSQVRALLALRPKATLAKVRIRDSCMPDVDIRVESLRLAGLPE